MDIFFLLAYIVANETEEIHNKLREEIQAVINVRIQPTLDPELVNYRPLRYDYSTKIDDKRISDEARRTRCSQIVFSILDHLQRWLRERRLHQDEKFKSVQSKNDLNNSKYIFLQNLNNITLFDILQRSVRNWIH